MTRSTSIISSAVFGAVIVALTIACGNTTPTPAAAVDVEIPDHYFIATDITPPSSIICRMTVEVESLSEIWQRPLMPCTLDAGWGNPESWGNWVTDDRATVTLDLSSTDWDRLSVRVKAYDGLPADLDQEISIECNGRPIGQSVLKRKWKDHTFEVPTDLLRVGPNSISLDFAHRASPQEAGRGKDNRRLAAAVRSIRLTRSGLKFFPKNAPDPVGVFDTETGLFVLERPGTLVLPTELPAGSTHLEVDIELTDDVDRGQTRITAEVASLDGRSIQTTDLAVEDTFRREAGPNTWSIPLDTDGAGGMSLITFDVEPRPAGAEIAISIPRPLPADGGRTAEQPAAQPEPATRRPDIVLITLDAARPDHFSCYGYGRPTTSEIDRVAASSMVFRNAFALAPYTLNSVPTMITGLSFFDHGVRSRDDTLAVEAATLAEYLSAAGYATVAFSATPSNSIAKGFDQGYDQFFELWKGRPRPPARDPQFVTERVVEWLESADVSRPLHLQVHYIPPHAPYIPNPRFDVFTDSRYDGPCTGAVKTLFDLESGLLDPDGGCLEHVRNRYDDNLLAADDAVGQLLDALSRRPRWRDTVLLITADHGEAFLEHGRMHHNSTVYDEMLQVPFILKTPTWINTSAVDTDRLVTLADIVPTLLATAGIRPFVPLEGIDLIDAATSPTSTDSRFFVAITTHKPPLFGLRTRRWKMLLSVSGHGALFDLDNDPGETLNLLHREPAIFSGLGLLLTSRATAPPVVAPSLGFAEITDQDRKMLEALGYVD